MWRLIVCQSSIARILLVFSSFSIGYTLWRDHHWLVERHIGALDGATEIVIWVCLLKKFTSSLFLYEVLLLLVWIIFLVAISPGWFLVTPHDCLHQALCIVADEDKGIAAFSAFPKASKQRSLCSVFPSLNRPPRQLLHRIHGPGEYPFH